MGTSTQLVGPKYEHSIRATLNAALAYGLVPFHAGLGIIKFTSRSPIRYGFIRNEDGELTTYKSGDRYVFVEPFETPLPRQQEIGIFQCLVLHHGKNGPPCRSCGVQGHKPGEDACKAKPKDKILAFKGYQHPLSNHYPSKLSVYDMDFKSLEAAFFLPHGYRI